MNETLLSMLIDLFKLYIKAQDTQTNNKKPRKKLSNADFDFDPIRLAQRMDSIDSMRVLSYLEEVHLPTECHGVLMDLEQMGIITPSIREVILENIEYNASAIDELTQDDLEAIVLETLTRCTLPQAANLHAKALLYFDNNETVWH